MENTQQAVGQYSKPKLTPAIEMFESAVKAWRQHLRQFLLIYWEGLRLALIPFGVLLLLAALNFIVFKEGNTPDNFKPLVALLTIASTLAALYFMIRAYMAIFLFIKHGHSGESKKLFQETNKLFWPYIGLSLLTAVLVLLWMLLLIIPGIIFSVFYSCAVYAFFFEDKRGMAAIKRSRQLVKGYFWQVFGRIMFLSLIAIIFMFIISLPVASLPKESIGAMFWNIVTQIISFLVGPIALYFSYYIYKDLVKIKQ